MDLRWGYLAALLLCLGGIVGCGFGIHQHQIEAMLDAHGVHANGTVRYSRAIDRRSTSTRGSSSSQQDFYLCVDYTANGVPIERWFEVTLWAMDTHSQGSTVDVVYDPADPSTVKLGGNLNSESSGWTFYGSVLAFVLGVLAALYIKLNYRLLSGDDDGVSPPQEGPWTNDPLSEDHPDGIPMH